MLPSFSFVRSCIVMISPLTPLTPQLPPPRSGAPAQDPLPKLSRSNKVMQRQGLTPRLSRGHKMIRGGLSSLSADTPPESGLRRSRRCVRAAFGFQFRPPAPRKTFSRPSPHVIIHERTPGESSTTCANFQSKRGGAGCRSGGVFFTRGWRRNLKKRRVTRILVNAGTLCRFG